MLRRIQVATSKLGLSVDLKRTGTRNIYLGADLGFYVEYDSSVGAPF